jgi:hypothetical protein
VMEPNHFWLNRPPQLRERWDRVRWNQRAQTVGTDRFVKRRVARQPKKWLATDLFEAPRGPLIAAAEVTLREGAMEAAAWAREEVTGAAAWVSAGPMELAVWVLGAEPGVKAEAMGAAASATEQAREEAEHQIRRPMWRLRSGLTWPRLASAPPRGWPVSRDATLRASTWSLFLRSNVDRADATGSQISKKHGQGYTSFAGFVVPVHLSAQ